ncbi:MAG: CoA-binding protein [Acidobacteria bacterium]|nr:CoA-binding protein [Acidobacteriota bacterium]
MFESHRLRRKLRAILRQSPSRLLPATPLWLPRKSPVTTDTPARDPLIPEIEAILTGCRTVAIVGLSSRPWRPSYRIGEYLKSVGYRIIPVNPNEAQVLEEKSYARLEEVPERMDVVNIFRRSEFVPPIVESAIRVGAKAVWMQEGVVHEEAAEQARAAGLKVVMNRCILREHLRLRAERSRATPLL